MAYSKKTSSDVGNPGSTCSSLYVMLFGFLSSFKNVALLVSACFVCSCATQKPVSYDIIANMEPDCGNKQLMTSWLNKQLVLNNSIYMTDSDIKYNNAVKAIIWKIRTQCPN